MVSALRIIVTGLITQHPLIGGITWHYLQYVLGLANLGHDVYYFEDSGEFPYNLDGGDTGTDWIARDCTFNVNYLAGIMARFGFENRWAYRFPLNSEWFGLSHSQREKVMKSADILINVSGSLEHPENYRQIPRLAYVDTDPIVTQIKFAKGDVNFCKRVDTHDSHFSFGESLSDTVPLAGYKWTPTRQPIMLSEWQPSDAKRDSFTTIMNWTSYAPLTYMGKTYGQKDVEFKRFLDLPRLVTPIPMEVALSGTQHLEWQEQESGQLAGAVGIDVDRPIRTPHDLLSLTGWRVVDAIEVGGDLDSYRQYIKSSKAEWSVAKNVYVLGRPGWFSERSACYLAAGRPVVVQDTGFGGTLPTGEGILAFDSVQEATDAIAEVEANYDRHANAARSIAKAYFDSDTVLARLIELAMSDR